MTLSVFQRTIVDNSGDTIGGATVEVRRESDGALVPLFSDRDGTAGISNPATAGPDGFLQFYAARGRYRIKATSGSYARTWRDVPLVDLDRVADPISEGARGDGVADDRSPIAKADGIAAAAGKALRFTFGAYLVGSDLTIASDAIFEPGAILKVPTGVTVTFEGAISAGTWQIFDLAGTGAIVPSDGQPAVHVAWFGAAWDGVTDDRAAVQAAWDAASAAGGGIVQLPPGTGIIGDRPSGTGLLQLYGSNIWLRGAGRGATIIKRKDNSEAATNDHMLIVDQGASFIKISDMTIDGNRANNTTGPQSTHNVLIRTASDVVVTDLEIKNAIYYGFILGGPDLTPERIIFKNSYVHTTGRSCVVFKNDSGKNDGIIIDNVIAEDCGLQEVSQEDGLFGFHGFVMASNLWGYVNATPSFGHHGIRIHGINADSPIEGRVQVSNFRMIGKTGHKDRPLVLITGREARLSNGLVRSGGNVGVQVQAPSCMLSNIDALENATHGFFLNDGGVNGVGEKTRMVNCVAKDNTSDGFLIETEFNSLTNCYAEANGVSGLDIDAGNNKFVACEVRGNGGTGVGIAAGADDNAFIECISAGNTGSDWNDSSAQTSWHTFRSGTATYTLSSGGSQAINFGTTFPNTCFGVVATMDGDPVASAEDVRVGSITKSGFVVRHRPNPGVVSRTIRYLAWGR